MALEDRKGRTFRSIYQRRDRLRACDWLYKSRKRGPEGSIDRSHARRREGQEDEEGKQQGGGMIDSACGKRVTKKDAWHALQLKTEMGIGGVHQMGGEVVCGVMQGAGDDVGKQGMHAQQEAHSECEQCRKSTLPCTCGTREVGAADNGLGGW